MDMALHLNLVMLAVSEAVTAPFRHAGERMPPVASAQSFVTGPAGETC